MKWTILGKAVAVATVAVLSMGVPAAHATNGDTHVSGQGLQRTVDCNDATLFVNGTSNTVTALGTCWAVTVMGSGNTVVADTVVNDITVWGFNQTVLFHNGDPFISDRGRELGMTNRLMRVPA